MSTLLLVLLVILGAAPAVPQCRRARGPSCRVPLLPGLHPLGWGVDVTTLDLSGAPVVPLQTSPPRAGASCVLCVDLLGRPGRLPPAAGGWRGGRRCRQGSRVATGGLALGTLVGSAEELAAGWRLGLRGLPGPAGRLVLVGSHSRLADFGLQRQREDRYGYAGLQLRCLHYWSHLSPAAAPSRSFLSAVASLPTRFSSSSADAFSAFFSTFGTHLVQGAGLGGLLRSVTAVRSCRAALVAASVREVATCLAAEVSGGGTSGGVSASISACRRARTSHQANVSFHELFTERLVEVRGGHQDGDLLYGDPRARSRWLRSLPASPALVAARLRPLHLLVAPEDPRRAALAEAIVDYVSWRSLRVKCGGGCRGGHAVAPCSCGCAAGAAGVTAECCSRHRGLAKLSVFVAGGAGWRGDVFSKPDVYVRAAYGAARAQTKTVWNAWRPRWDVLLEMGTVELLPGRRLLLEVWDEDNRWDDDLLGTCQEEIRAGGNRSGVCFPGGGRLDFSYRAACGPALGGPLCADYVPQEPPEEDGGVSRFSTWPPGPGEGPPAPSKPPSHLEGIWGGLEEAGGEGGGEEMGFVEPTDAFGDLPEPFGDLEEGWMEAEEEAGGQQELLEARKDLPGPPAGGGMGPPELEVTSGVQEAPSDLLDPGSGAKMEPPDLLDSGSTSQEAPSDLLDPGSGAKMEPPDLLDSGSGLQEAP
ncbi:perforin-1 [Phaenicophaeus curvirostris]|uniref:perforin-1 n=1 Tax=Phaenicophaeus curvirostris TaxID=33595 RepID=UPI0037F0E964